MATAFFACNSQGNESAGDEPVTDGVAEPIPTPVGELNETESADNLNVLLEEYLNVKEALVEDEYENAKREAGNLVSLFNSVEQRELLEMKRLSGQQQKELSLISQKLAEAQDIETLRAYFAALSNKLYELAQADLLTNKTLYWQHCPMALDNKGANWLSLEEEIQNPYMGQKMPECGSVMEVLEN